MQKQYGVFFIWLFEQNSAEDTVIYGDIYYTQEIIDKILKSKNDITTAIDKNWKKTWKLKENFYEDLETLKIKK